MLRSCAVLFAAFVAALSAVAQDVAEVEAYRVPPKEILDLVDAPLPPSLLAGPGEWAVLAQMPTLLTIEDLAQPELRLAGLRFNPQNREQTRAS